MFVMMPVQHGSRNPVVRQGDKRLSSIGRTLEASSDSRYHDLRRKSQRPPEDSDRLTRRKDVYALFDGWCYHLSYKEDHEESDSLIGYWLVRSVNAGMLITFPTGSDSLRAYHARIV